VDAYTRVSLSEDLTFYTRGDATKIIEEDLLPTKFVTVDAAAIEDSVENWKDQTASYKTANFEQVVATADDTADENNTLAGIIFSGDTPITTVSTGKGLHLYAKVDTASSQDSDAKTTETGDNISFIGYYLDDKENAYEVKITPNIVYKSSEAGDGNPDVDGDTGKSIWTDYIDYKNSKIDVQVYSATEVEVKKSTISDYVEIEFTDNGDWYYENGYFYYTKVLASGQSTTPLIKAVRLKNDVGDEMINATYNLKVNDESTQATKEAAEGVFDTSVFIGKDTNIASGKDGKGCDFSKTENATTVCSADTGSKIMNEFNTTRGWKEFGSIAKTTPTTTKQTTLTEADSNEVDVNEDNIDDTDDTDDIDEGGYED
jgi:hypothetical protein